MNSRISNKVVLQSLRHSHCRYLSVQRNINKCSSTCHTFNFARRKENQSSSFIFTKLSNDRTLCKNKIPIYTYFQRNLSGTSQLNQTASAEQLNKAANVAPPSVEQLNKAANVTPPSVEQLNKAANVTPPSVEQLNNAADVTPPAEEAAQNFLSTFFGPEIAEHSIIEYCQQVLLEMHEATGLPWWVTIALTAFFIRTTVVLPFSITQLRLMAKLEKVNLQLDSIEKRLKKETVKAQNEYGWPEKLTKEKYKEAVDKSWWNLVNEENCHPAKAYFLISVQVSTWITLTAATNSLCNPMTSSDNIYNQLTTGGFGWVTDLTVVDPYLILPIMLALINLSLVEVHQSFKVIRRSNSEQWKTAIFRLVSLGLIPMAASVPAAVNVYWLSSSFYGLLQALLLNSSPARRLFRVSMNDPELKHPYRFFLKNMKENFRKTTKRDIVIQAK